MVLQPFPKVQMIYQCKKKFKNSRKKRVHMIHSLSKKSQSALDLAGSRESRVSRNLFSYFST